MHSLVAYAGLDTDSLPTWKFLENFSKSDCIFYIA